MSHSSRYVNTYTLQPDGPIDVINRCWKGSLDGELDIAEGRARVVEGSGNGRLEVSFFGPFWGDYWIIDLDPEYRWAVVSDAEGRYLWILAREPRPGDAFLAERYAALEARGFDTDGLIRPDQWSSREAMPRAGLPGAD